MKVEGALTPALSRRTGEGESFYRARRVFPERRTGVSPSSCFFSVNDTLIPALSHRMGEGDPARARFGIPGSRLSTFDFQPLSGSGLGGFSLIEVMVAILVLGIALVGLTQGVATALSSSKESELQATAALIAAGQVEAVRAQGDITDAETEGDCGESLPLYRWKQTVTPAGIDGLHDVDVVVENAQSGQEVYELRTLLFEMPSDSSGATGANAQGRSNRKEGRRQ